MKQEIVVYVGDARRVVVTPGEYEMPFRVERLDGADAWSEEIAGALKWDGCCNWSASAAHLCDVSREMGEIAACFAAVVQLAPLHCEKADPYILRAAEMRNVEEEP